MSKIETLFKKISVVAIVILLVQISFMGIAITAKADEPVGPSVDSLTLINADTDTAIGALSEADVINLATAPTLNLNIQANVSGTVESVYFSSNLAIDSLGDPTNRTENSVPYASAGDTSGNYTAWTPTVGQYTLTVTAYTLNDKGGTVSTPLTVNFKVINDGEAPVITLNGANPQVVEKGETYTELGATVTDNVDVGIVPTINTSSVDTSTVGSYTVTYDAVDVAGNNATQVTRTVNVVDTTVPVFTPSTEPAFAGPGATSIKIVVTTNEPLQQDVIVGSQNQQVGVLQSCSTCGATITIEGVSYPAYDPDGNNTYEYIYNFGGFVGKKTVNFTVNGIDLAGNPGAEARGSFEIDNIVLSPVVETPQATLAVAAVTTPEPTVQNDQFGGNSEQGEVKADTTIQADNGNNGENKDDKKEDTKGKKNIPLWGIIFLLILAGIGGYLFYSQSPEKVTGKK